MSYKESRRPWRKLWRKEPARRQGELSYHARTLAVFLLRHADDFGCLGPVPKRGNAAATLGEMLAVPARNRKAFYREMKELLDYGDDDEQLALVIRDGHFFLTRFEECQAVRRSRDKTGQSKGQDRDKTGREQGPSLAPKHAEPFESETELGAEVRREKREERNSINGEAKKEGERKADDSATAGRPAEREPGSLAKRMYAKFFEERYGKPRTNLDCYDEHFEQIEEHARQQPGNVRQVLDYVYRAFFADRSQVTYGQHSPATLAGKGFFIHVRGYAEGYEAERRAELEREHSANVHAKLDADKEQWQRERAEAEHMRNGQGPMAMAELMRSLGAKVE